jgi:hypothetical protein
MLCTNNTFQRFKPAKSAIEPKQQAGECQLPHSTIKALPIYCPAHSSSPPLPSFSTSRFGKQPAAASPQAPSTPRRPERTATVIDVSSPEQPTSNGSHVPSKRLSSDSDIVTELPLASKRLRKDDDSNKENTFRAKPVHNHIPEEHSITDLTLLDDDEPPRSALEAVQSLPGTPRRRKHPNAAHITPMSLVATRSELDLMGPGTPSRHDLSSAASSNTTSTGLMTHDDLVGVG